MYLSDRAWMEYGEPLVSFRCRRKFRSCSQFSVRAVNSSRNSVSTRLTSTSNVSSSRGRGLAECSYVWNYLASRIAAVFRFLLSYQRWWDSSHFGLSFFCLMKFSSTFTSCAQALNSVAVMFSRSVYATCREPSQNHSILFPLVEKVPSMFQRWVMDPPEFG